MTPKEFRKYERRDGYCPHCGKVPPYLIPHHRANRGSGGSKLANRASNILAICSILNGEMESNPLVAEMARAYGWKLSRYENPLIVPVFDALTGNWYQLDDNYGRRILNQSPHQ